MAATADDYMRLRRMTNENSPTSTYSDEDLEAILTRHAYTNSDGDVAYDFHAAAEEVWTEKASALADAFDFSADGGSFQHSQKYKHYLKIAMFHGTRKRIRRQALQYSGRTRTEIETGLTQWWIVNNPEEDN